MPAKTSIQKKMAILRMINEKKIILYGKFTTDLENRTKTATWEEVLTLAKSLELVSAHRHWKYIRDNLYSGWKTSAMAKHDKLRRIGSAGGRELLLDEAEKYIVEEIVGRNSPVAEGLGIGESGRPRPRPPALNDNEETLHDEDDTGPSNSHVDSAQRSRSTSRPSKRRKTEAEIGINQSQSQNRKSELQIDLLEAQLYKSKLECLKLERELQIETSKFTENLITCPSYEVSYLDM